MTDDPSRMVEKSTWTDADFDRMGWHDAALHAVALEPSPPHPGRLLLDIDYIVEWVAPTPPETTYGFWMCPATLVFEGAADFVGDLSLVGRAFAPSIDAISRTEPDAHGTRTWTIAGHEFTMQLRAPGYAQYFRSRPLFSDNAQRLSLAPRRWNQLRRAGLRLAASAATHRATAVPNCSSSDCQPPSLETPSRSWRHVAP